MGRAPMAWWGVTALPNGGAFVIIGRWRREAVELSAVRTNCYEV